MGPPQKNEKHNEQRNKKGSKKTQTCKNTDDTVNINKTERTTMSASGRCVCVCFHRDLSQTQ